MKERLMELKDYCKKYVSDKYGKDNNYIRRTRITRNGLFIYGHRVYAPNFNGYFPIQTYISQYDVDNKDYINDLLDLFVLDCQRLKESD